MAYSRSAWFVMARGTHLAGKGESFLLPSRDALDAPRDADASVGALVEAQLGEEGVQEWVRGGEGVDMARWTPLIMN